LYQYKLSGYSGIRYTCLISGPIFAAHPAPFLSFQPFSPFSA